MRGGWLLGLLSGCSLFFDPSKVPLSGCPLSSERCPVPGNAKAICVESACGYQCLDGFLDADGKADNGCEVPCAAVQSPDSLDGVNDPDGTTVKWTFPAVAEATGYSLCTNVGAAAPACTTIPTSACQQGLCTASTTGHPTFVQVFGRVEALNACGAASTRGPTATAFTVRISDLPMWTGDLCTPMVAATGNALSVEVTSLCTGTSMVGTETWQRGTFEVDLRPSLSGADLVAGGLTFSSGTRRLQVLAGPNTLNVDQGTSGLREARNSQFFSFLAMSGASIEANEWSTLRVVLNDGVWSINLGRRGVFKEVLRYFDPLPPTSWRVGLGAANVWNTGRIDLRQFTLSTASTLPPKGPTSASWTFTPDGGSNLPFRNRSNASNPVRFEPCPAFPSACDGGASCLPDAGTCARVARSAGAASLTFDMPVGLDTRLPWDLSFRFAPAADGGYAPTSSVAFATSTKLLDCETVWDGGLRTFDQRLRGVVVRPDTWNLAEYHFDPTQNAYSVTINGQPANVIGMPRFPPTGSDRHLGAVVIGAQGFGNIDLWLSEIGFSQP